MAKGDDIQERLIDFAVNVIQLSSKLANSAAEKHVANQLLRSGTSPAPNYAEARSAESPKDFLHKLRVALKELNETKIWLQIILRSQMMSIDECYQFQNECDELCRIISASIKTSLRKNHSQC
ncbi:MAG: four helix bundle protein [Desulfobacterium sp.]|nr:four helix bundle protein [Desulfobacterium sp.]